MVKKCLNIVNVVCEWPHPRTFSVHNLRNNCHFLNHLPTPMSLRNSRPETNVGRNTHRGKNPLSGFKVNSNRFSPHSVSMFRNWISPDFEILRQICSHKIWILDQRPKTLIEVKIPYLTSRSIPIGLGDSAPANGLHSVSTFRNWISHLIFEIEL